MPGILGSKSQTTQSSGSILGKKKPAPKVEEVKKPSKITQVLADVGKKVYDTYENDKNKDRMSLLASDKVFSLKDAEEYTKGPEGENKLVNAALKPVRGALYTALAPMRWKPFNRSISQATNTMLMDENASEKVDTGSKLGNTLSDIAGTVIGYGVNAPGTGGSLLNLSQGLSKPVEKAIAKNVASKTTSKIANRILPAIGREFVEGSGLSVLSDVMNEKDAKTITKNALVEGAIGSVLGAGFEGVKLGKEAFLNTDLGKATVKNIDKVKTTIVNALKNKLSKGTLEKVDMPKATKEAVTETPTNKITSPTLKGNKFKVKNTVLENAYSKYNEAVDDIHNHFQTNQLTPDEMARIKPELGIDLDKLVSDIEKAETSGSLKSIANKKNLSYAAGVNPMPNNKLNKISSLSQPIPTDNVTIGIGLKTTSLPKSIDDMSIRELNKVKRNLQANSVNPSLSDSQKQLYKNDLDKLNSYIGITKGKELNPNFNSTKTIVNTTPNAPIKTIDDVVSSAKNWNDKPKLSLKRETMERNFDDMMGKDAPKMKEIYIEPVKKGEADRVRFVNKERADVKNLGIKFKSSEDELVQKYGEKLITLDELKKATPNWKNVSDAADYMRKKYDDLLTQVNTVLERNNYAPIPKRKDYFPHYEEVDDMLSKLGLKLEDQTLPTDINGITANFKPGKNFFSNALQRKGTQTTYGVLEGFDRYIEGISKVIYQTDNIKRLRQLEKSLREGYAGTTHLSNFVSELTEYTNLLAGKKAMIDRGAEDVLGRNVYKAVDGLRRRVGSNAVGLNISSALTNYIPLTQSLATTDKTSFLKGMLDTIGSKFVDDGFINKSDFLTRRIGSDRLAMNLWDKSLDKANWLFKSIDDFTGQVIVRSKYLEGIKKGLPEAEALKQADNFASRLIADRSAGSLPTLFGSKTLGLVSQFQVETNNQLSFIFKDIPRNSKSKAAAASSIAQVFLYGYIFNNLYEKIVGRRPAFDPIGVIQKAYNDYTNPNLNTKQANKETIQNISDQLPFSSVFTGGRIPLANAFPSFMGLATGETTPKKELIKVGTSLALPTGGSQIKKTIQGLQAIKDEGVYNDSKTQLKYPITPTTKNKIKAGLFGPSALKETQNYYNNYRTPLTEKQTKQVNAGNDKEKVYNNILKKKEMDGIKLKIASIRKDNSIPWEERQKEINKLMEQLKKLQ